MSQFGLTQLDSLLNFSKLHLLIFNSNWKLRELHPNHHSFLGWDEVDIETFEFNNNFLDPNHIDLEKFLGHFQEKNYVVKNYYWRNADQQISGPFETYFRIKKESGFIQSVMAFVKISDEPIKIEITPDIKQRIYLADQLPGIIHNIATPLGTISGHLELLLKKYPQSEEFKQLLKISHRIKSILLNLNNKIKYERSETPRELDLNQLIQKEVDFLNADPFFNHQVEKNLKFERNLPTTNITYLSLSGILSEFYQFFRKLINEDQIYVLQVETTFERDMIGLFVNFLGDFQIPETLNFRFPVKLEGDANQIAQQQVDGLDLVFLSYCLRKNSGILEITGRREMLTLRLNLHVSNQS